MDNYTLSYYPFDNSKNMEDLKHSLLCTSMELETTRVAAQQEVRWRDEQIIHLKELLSRVMAERDEANEKCRKFIDKIHPLSGVSSVVDEDPSQRKGMDSNNGGFSSSDGGESIVSSPILDPLPEKPLPEKGKLLQAVMNAGPLLQTLLLAGPLPRWKHPPPPISAFDIPPVTVPLPLSEPEFFKLNADNGDVSCCGRFDRKRGSCEGVVDSSSRGPKFQRLLLR